MDYLGKRPHKSTPAANWQKAACLSLFSAISGQSDVICGGAGDSGRGKERGENCAKWRSCAKVRPLPGVTAPWLAAVEAVAQELKPG